MLTVEPRLIRIREVIRLTGISRSTLYQLMKSGRFPKPEKLGKLALWKLSEVDRFISDPTNYTV